MARVERPISFPLQSLGLLPLLIIKCAIESVPSSLKRVLGREITAMYLYAAMKKGPFDAYSGFNQVIST
ncbi:MAG: hypothetical protein HPY61_07620 [Methanotrichaceae archaeon]|nr:hypothetical protein [Methanotrichaceae archaeon]